jgi:hypothetical protein
MGTTLELLERSLESESSPLRFQASVHNAAAGLLSIATKNRSFCTALAAGPGTVAAALLEAFALLCSQERISEVVVLLGDEAPVRLLTDQTFIAFGAALHLKRGVDERALGRLSVPYFAQASQASIEAERALPRSLIQNPICPALQLVRNTSARVPVSTRLEIEAAPSNKSWQVDFEPNASP